MKKLILFLSLLLSIALQTFPVQAVPGLKSDNYTFGLAKFAEKPTANTVDLHNPAPAPTSPVIIPAETNPRNVPPEFPSAKNKPVCLTVTPVNCDNPKFKNHPVRNVPPHKGTIFKTPAEHSGFGNNN